MVFEVDVLKPTQIFTSFSSEWWLLKSIHCLTFAAHMHATNPEKKKFVEHCIYLWIQIAHIIFFSLRKTSWNKAKQNKKKLKETKRNKRWAKCFWFCVLFFFTRYIFLPQEVNVHAFASQWSMGRLCRDSHVC